MNLRDPEKMLEKMKNYYKFFNDKLKDETDSELIEDYEDNIKELDKYINKSSEYLDKVVNFKKQRIKIERLAQDTQDYQYQWQKFDESRKDDHDSCINQLILIDRLCKINNIDPVYGEFDEYFKNSNNLLKNKSEMSGKDKGKRREIGEKSLYNVAYFTIGMFVDPEKVKKYIENEEEIPGIEQEIDKALEQMPEGIKATYKQYFEDER